MPDIQQFMEDPDFGALPQDAKRRILRDAMSRDPDFGKMDPDAQQRTLNAMYAKFPDPLPAPTLTGEAAPITGYRNLQYVGPKGRGLANKGLLDELDATAARLGVRLGITSAYRPGAITKSGHRSRHADQYAVDIATVNGVSVLDKKGGAWGDMLHTALVEQGFVSGHERPGQRNILWRTNVGGNHFNHLHISYARPTTASGKPVSAKSTKNAPVGSERQARAGRGDTRTLPASTPAAAARTATRARFLVPGLGGQLEPTRVQLDERNKIEEYKLRWLRTPETEAATGMAAGQTREPGRQLQALLRRSPAAQERYLAALAKKGWSQVGLQALREEAVALTPASARRANISPAVVNKFTRDFHLTDTPDRRFMNGPQRLLDDAKALPDHAREAWLQSRRNPDGKPLSPVTIAAIMAQLEPKPSQAPLTKLQQQRQNVLRQAAKVEKRPPSLLEGPEGGQDVTGLRALRNRGVDTNVVLGVLQGMAPKAYKTIKRRLEEPGAPAAVARMVASFGEPEQMVLGAALPAGKVGSVAGLALGALQAPAIRERFREDPEGATMEALLYLGLPAVHAPAIAKEIRAGLGKARQGLRAAREKRGVSRIATEQQAQGKAAAEQAEATLATTQLAAQANATHVLPDGTYVVKSRAKEGFAPYRKVNAQGKAGKWLKPEETEGIQPVRTAQEAAKAAFAKPLFVEPQKVTVVPAREKAAPKPRAPKNEAEKQLVQIATEYGAIPAAEAAKRRQLVSPAKPPEKGFGLFRKVSGRENVLFLNRKGMDLMARVTEGETDLIGRAAYKGEAWTWEQGQRAIDRLNDIAQNPKTSFEDRGHIEDLIGAIDEARRTGDGSLALVDAAPEPGETMAAYLGRVKGTVFHEQAHRGVIGVTRGEVPAPVAQALESHPLWSRVSSRLTERGYEKPMLHEEAIAHLASDDYNTLGLTREEHRTLLRDTVRSGVEAIGEDWGDVFLRSSQQARRAVKEALGGEQVQIRPGAKAGGGREAAPALPSAEEGGRGVQPGVRRTVPREAGAPGEAPGVTPRRSLRNEPIKPAVEQSEAVAQARVSPGKREVVRDGDEADLQRSFATVRRTPEGVEVAQPYTYREGLRRYSKWEDFQDRPYVLRKDGRPWKQGPERERIYADDLITSKGERVRVVALAVDREKIGPYTPVDPVRFPLQYHLQGGMFYGMDNPNYGRVAMASRGAATDSAIRSRVVESHGRAVITAMADNAIVGNLEFLDVYTRETVNRMADGAITRDQWQNALAGAMRKWEERRQKQLDYQKRYAASGKNAESVYIPSDIWTGKNPADFMPEDVHRIMEPLAFPERNEFFQALSAGEGMLPWRSVAAGMSDPRWIKANTGDALGMVWIDPQFSIRANKGTPGRRMAGELDVPAHRTYDYVNPGIHLGMFQDAAGERIPISMGQMFQEMWEREGITTPTAARILKGKSYAGELKAGRSAVRGGEPVNSVQVPESVIQALRAAEGGKQVFTSVGFPSPERAAGLVAETHAAAMKRKARLTHPGVPVAESTGAVDVIRRYARKQAARSADMTADEVVKRYKETGTMPVSKAWDLLGSETRPAYLDGLVEHMTTMRSKLLKGEVSPADVAKAWYITVASQGAQSISPTFVEGQLPAGKKIPSDFLEYDPKTRKTKVRPEDVAAYWLMTEEGRAAVDKAAKGEFDPADWEGGLKARDVFGGNRVRSFGLMPEVGRKVSKEVYTRAVVGRQGKAGYKLDFHSLKTITDAINEVGKGIAAGTHTTEDLQRVAGTMLGVGVGKIGFLQHFLGFGDRPTFDAREINWWLTGTKDARNVTNEQALLVSEGAKILAPYLLPDITANLDAMAAKVSKNSPDVTPEVSRHVMHHWLWDAIGGTETSHKALYEAFRPDARRFARKSKPTVASLPETATALWKAGLLGRPSTHAKNILSTGLFQLMEEAARVPASVADIVVNAARQKGRTIGGFDLRGVSEGIVGAATEGAAQGLELLRTGKVKGDKFSRPKDVREEVKTVTPVFDAWINLNFRALSTEDRVMRVYAYKAARRSYENLVKSGKAALTPREIDILAIADAEVATFNSSNQVAGIVRGARKAAGPTGKAILDTIVPFPSTPTNVLARTLEYAAGVGIAPVQGGIRAIQARQIADAATRKAFSDQAQRDFARTFGRGTIGLGIMYMGYKLAEAGVLTPPGTDYADKAQGETTGAPAGAIRFGGRWLVVTSIAPLGTLLGLGAGIYAISHGPEEEKTKESMKLGQTLYEQFPLQAGAQTVAAGIGPEMGGRAKSFAGSVVPGIVRDVAALTDTKQRRAGTVMETIQKGVPGLRQRLPAQITGLGEEVPRPLPFDPFASVSAKESGAQRAIRVSGAKVGAFKPKKGETGAQLDARARRIGSLRRRVLNGMWKDPAFRALSKEEMRNRIERAIRIIDNKFQGASPGKF